MRLKILSFEANRLNLERLKSSFEDETFTLSEVQYKAE